MEGKTNSFFSEPHLAVLPSSCAFLVYTNEVDIENMSLIVKLVLS